MNEHSALRTNGVRAAGCATAPVEEPAVAAVEAATEAAVGAEFAAVFCFCGFCPLRRLSRPLRRASASCGCCLWPRRRSSMVCCAPSVASAGAAAAAASSLVAAVAALPRASLPRAHEAKSSPGATSAWGAIAASGRAGKEARREEEEAKGSCKPGDDAVIDRMQSLGLDDPACFGAAYSGHRRFSNYSN